MASEISGPGRSSALPLVREPPLDGSGVWLPATQEVEHSYCSECGKPFVEGAALLTWKEAPSPWWVWLMVALGAILTTVFGLATWQASRERSAAQEIRRVLPTSETSLEGPSVQRAAAQAEAPPGTGERYFAAEYRLKHALVDLEFALVTVALGIGLLARRSLRRRRAASIPGTGAAALLAPLDPARGAFLAGWALAENLALSAFRLVTVTFLYLVISRVGAGESPTWGVLQDTLDRTIQIVAKVPGLVR